MIDLRERGLPDAIECGGEVFAINTDFRVWIEFERMLSEGRVWLGIFAGEVPASLDWVEQAVAFLRSGCKTPRKGGSKARLVDFVEDGERIVASFQSAYGIDLTDPGLDMHWHRFLALFRGLPDDTAMAKVMGYRSWERKSRKHEDVMSDMRERYRLPDPGEEEHRAEVLKLAEELFG